MVFAHDVNLYHTLSYCISILPMPNDHCVTNDGCRWAGLLKCCSGSSCTRFVWARGPFRAPGPKWPFMALRDLYDLHVIHTVNYMLFTCYLHVIYMLFTCYLHVTNMLFTCYLHVTYMLFTCYVHYVHVIYMLFTCYLHVISILFTCNLHVIYILFTCYLHVIYMLIAC